AIELAEKAAGVSRKFPDTRVVRSGERLPVARLMARVGDGPAEALLAARDGVLYKGRGYPPGLEAGLPWLDGVRLSRAGAGFAPIEGMETVSDLLEQARTDAPELYRDIRVVSLERLAEDGVLLARMGAAERVRFGTREGFPAQIRRLEWTLGRLRAENPGARVRSVDLSIGATQVPVTLDEAPAARGARTARGRIFQP
ncbi:MAG: hypothetical protein LBR12_00815, partial [Opitutaceae bacterium]|nr:hypothetical protein [Opitutaceae bacterium]